MPTSSLVAIFIFSFAVGFGAVITPGPVSTAIVSQSPRSGWRVGPLVSTGHALMELAVVLLISLGLSTVLAHPTVQILIALVGGILLAGMGGGMIFSVLSGEARLPGAHAGIQAMAPRQMIALGVIATVTNPFWYAWWVTVAAGYLAQAQALGAASVAAFYLGHVSADYGWNTALSTLIGGGRRWVTERVYRILIGLCGLFLVYLGVQFLIRGVGMFP